MKQKVMPYLPLLEKWMRPWFAVLVGVGMTIASAIISHHQVANNMNSIAALEKKASQIDQTIHDTWQNMARFERDGNEALLLVTMAEGGDPAAALNPTVVNNMVSYVWRFLEESDVKEEKLRVRQALQNREVAAKGMVFREILSLVDAQRAHVVKKNDQLYSEKATLQEQVQEIHQKNASSANMALVLQMLGVMCVLCPAVMAGVKTRLNL